MKILTLLLPAILAPLSLMKGADYSPAITTIESTVRGEMREWGIGGISVALIDDQSLVYANGFGEAKRDSIFRAGSISKLFNAIAVMQQVEAGKIDLDAALPPEVSPVNPFPGQPLVTPRQILSHRSGLQRESPVGGYFDATQPGIDATARSVADCVLATKPAEKTRYSNVAPTIAGWMVEKASGEAFEDYQKKHIFGPLGMTSSAWTLANTDRNRVIVSHMRVADGKGGWTRIQSPVFDLGTIPAGNLFTTVEDLGKFASALMAKGGGLVKPESLEAMWKPQFTTDETGFGLAFVAGKFRKHLTIGHNGAVYGHSASLVVLPREKIAVVVIGNEDIANGRIHRISDLAISLMLEAKTGEKPPVTPEAAMPAEAAALAGSYESQSYWAELQFRDGKLSGEMSGQPLKFTPAGGLKFVVNSRIDDNAPVEFQKTENGAITGFSLGVQKFTRVPANPAPLPKSWHALLGSYGPGFIPLIVSERHGHLYAMTENMVDYRLTPVNRHVFSLCPGMYADEEAVFLTHADGSVRAVDFASMTFTKNK
ncbi:MAG: serine hydrolase domain-containing protein [Verrucomicrobiota bacterium]